MNTFFSSFTASHIVVDIILAVIAVLFILIYAKRGFLKSLLHSLKNIFAFVAAYFFGGKLAAIFADAFLGTAVREAVFKKVSSLYADASNSLNMDEVTKSFPSFIMTDDVKAKLNAAEGTGDPLVNSVTDTIATPITTVISNVLGYIAVFIVALIVLSIVVAILNRIISHIAIFRFANTLLGALLGVVIAMLVLFIISSVIKFFAGDSDLYLNSAILKFFGDFKLPEALNFLDLHSLLNEFSL